METECLPLSNCNWLNVYNVLRTWLNDGLACDEVNCTIECNSEGSVLGPQLPVKSNLLRFFLIRGQQGVKTIRIDPLEPNIWLYYVYYDLVKSFAAERNLVRKRFDSRRIKSSTMSASSWSVHKRSGAKVKAPASMLLACSLLPGR